jgi:hypothetical protein
MFFLYFAFAIILVFYSALINLCFNGLIVIKVIISHLKNFGSIFSENLTECVPSWRYKRHNSNLCFVGDFDMKDTLSTLILKLDWPWGHFLGHNASLLYQENVGTYSSELYLSTWECKAQGKPHVLWKFQAHYHLLTGTNDSSNVVKFSIDRLIIKVDGRSINTIKFAIILLSLAASYRVFINLSRTWYYFVFLPNPKEWGNFLNLFSPTNGIAIAGKDSPQSFWSDICHFGHKVFRGTGFYRKHPDTASEKSVENLMTWPSQDT